MLGTTCPSVYIIMGHLKNPSSAVKVVSVWVLEGKVCLKETWGLYRSKESKLSPSPTKSKTEQEHQSGLSSNPHTNSCSPCEASHHQSRLTPEDELFQGSLTGKPCDSLIGNISKEDPVLSFPGIHHRFSTSCFIFPGLQSGHHESAAHIWISQVPVQMAGISIHRSLKHTTPRVH